ncbi:quinone-dependent dihydroorotate dehydrogenase [Chitinophagaceae bacterium LB-8]|jgi:dihydroorotate dehydrogenase|uniref:Dihydroorotate dehydrogenase (quinone) n=1 Tax=Paraflavisolibacter caeni TaxID=2982496 RepID=A0A9X2XSG8_9BACT|nr:quinone-dependent dihydroorotate dehydrogenase [Paraflavisolibacter caeni]MCU7548051.1 quinone-dependent dihydroorotate dehydrogenase [Paraflavisolibacter caeni]
MYQQLRSILFRFQPETAHHISMFGLRTLSSIPFVRKSLSKLFSPKRLDGGSSLVTKHFGLTFKNPIGLGAGFDKNANYLSELEMLGFGFVEIGTVTPKAQPGNDQPRLFRLPQDKALINRMGFNNEGVEVVAKRLKAWKERQLSMGNGQSRTHLPLIIGGNIGKNKVTPNEDAWKDYEICFKSLHDYVDFFVVNVSSPNTPGLRELQEKDALKRILTHLQTLNKDYKQPRPILLKIAPDLTWTQIDDVVDLAKEINLDGLVATNTTIDRSGLQTKNEEVQEIGAGGLSGLPLQKRATEVVSYIHKKTGGTIPIIASGGIFTANDAKEKMQAGGILCEVWTGFIYEGPFIVKKICDQL